MYSLLYMMEKIGDLMMKPKKNDNLKIPHLFFYKGCLFKIRVFCPQKDDSRVSQNQSPFSRVWRGGWWLVSHFEVRDLQLSQNVLLFLTIVGQGLSKRILHVVVTRKKKRPDIRSMK